MQTAIYRPSLVLQLTRSSAFPCNAYLHRSTLLPLTLRPLTQDSYKGHSQQRNDKWTRRKRRYQGLAVALTIGVAAYFTIKPFRHFLIAVKRCSLVGLAVSLDVIDYKLLFAQKWKHEEELDTERGVQARKDRHLAYKACHKRCAERILVVLKKNGGIYVKVGQHISSVQMLPIEWSSTMRPLQDQCFPTDVEDGKCFKDILSAFIVDLCLRMFTVERLFQLEVGQSINDLFSSFDVQPLGVASLAQVHRATDKATNRKVAVKVMHPDLEDFADIDIKTSMYLLRFVKKLFPAFAFEWLGEEMQQNLPLEMDFRHEAKNAEKCRRNFANLKKTPLVIPEVLYSTKRVLVMEFIDGARPDNTGYLDQHNINRNQVSQELARIFSKMVYTDGFFHADPHAGNLLIRPKIEASRSPFNFEIALLDHGLYFDLSDQLRINYARFWLSLIAPSTKKVEAQRRQYAKDLAGIDDELYLIFQSAITGRASFGDNAKFSLLEMKPSSTQEVQALRKAVAEGNIMQSIFELLRQLPKRLVMVLKLNDLTRSLDAALQTTHGPAVWLIIARYCARTAWLDDLDHLRMRWQQRGFSLGLVQDWISNYVSFQSWNTALIVAESTARLRGFIVSFR